MKVNTIPAPTLTAIHTLLAPHVPELTPTALVAALRGYEPEGEARPPSAPAEPMLALEDAAATLSISVCTARRMVKSGRLPGRKVGKLWRIPAAAVKALAATGEGR